ncbi:MAG TPA: hypothetical protein PLO51_00020 [Candidatus Micrarchaeota archaeon]|nr:hypothetical protein [Candidatus Micrarchaeota archaeon]
MKKSSELLFVIALVPMLFFAGCTSAPQTQSQSQSAFPFNIPQSQPASQGTSAVTIYMLNVSNCTQCVSFDSQVQQIKSAAGGVVFTEKDLVATSAEAKQIAAQYGVTNAPAVIMTGDVGKIAAPSGWARANGALISPAPSPPYLSLASGNITGLVSAVIVSTSSCAQCSTDVSQFIDQLKQGGVAFSGVRTIDSESPEGKTYVQEYGAGTTPFLVLSGGFSAYFNNTNATANQWSNPGLGRWQVGSDYVMGTINPPYFNLSTGQVVGLLSMTVINDKKCANCTDMSKYKDILVQGGLAIGDYKALDITDPGAAALAKEYNISKLPAFVISGDFGPYSPDTIDSLMMVGNMVNGSFVLTNYDIFPNAKYVAYTPA